MEEIWKPIEECNDYYISNFGRIKSFKYDKVNGKIMKPSRTTKGYLQLDLQLDGRKRQNRVHLAVHRLVARAFIPNPDNLPQVNHKDENKENNHVNNLEWCTNEYNSNYGTHAERVGAKQRKPIYSVDVNGNIEEFDGLRVAARKITGKTNASTSSIQYALKNENKTAYGRKWFYKEVV